MTPSTVPCLLWGVVLIAGSVVGGCAEASTKYAPVRDAGGGAVGTPPGSEARNELQPVGAAIDTLVDDSRSTLLDADERKPAERTEVAQAEPPARNDQPAEAETPKPARPQAGDGAAPPRPVPLSRRIIYTATLTLVVKDFAEAEKKIAGLVDDLGGYISKTDLSRRTGTNRYGQWVVRIPVPRYQEFLDQLGNLGVPENLQQQAQDVTQEFIDLEARISNQKRLEDRLIKLLEKREGELKEVIEVERELARVRSEIEQMQGRLRYLANQVALTTVTINVREEQNYVPPQAPSFGGRIATTWAQSLTALQEFGQGATLFCVAVAPWLVILVPCVLFVRWLWSRRRSRRAAG